MPLYRMFCIAAHYPEYRHIKDLVSQSAKLLLDHGSTVRQIQYLGSHNLPQRMRRHKHYHTAGDYWSMHFDAPPSLLAQLNERMRTDPRVVRWTMLKLGERLEDVVDSRRSTMIFHETNPYSMQSEDDDLLGNLGISALRTSPSGLSPDTFWPRQHV
ncbi:hypothetical protein M0805_006354 [Coniferiporia weirii]|nr:hypothetical protein M0805_006354 [Coniferiporia weirii]